MVDAESEINASVRALGAYCELSWGRVSVGDDDFRLTEGEMALDCLEAPDSQFRSSFPLLVAASPDRELARTLSRQIDFQVSEFADLVDGRRIMLRDDRCWSARFTRDWWQHVTREYLTEETKKVFARDECEDRSDRLKCFGVKVDPASLRSAPYMVEFGPYVLVRLQRT